ncbi:hypothetical protein OE88DRAFT_61960 [Heliocybe sulcata]|uniref:Integral membrane protein n=1 Tax=Heliocybe sulcata TaxID=5364 RepID=A0A5C3NK29_9AGAM|nr:hypothetical protein OE88DRAFT_61960 [Heliocybe sulcata]
MSYNSGAVPGAPPLIPPRPSVPPRPQPTTHRPRPPVPPRPDLPPRPSLPPRTPAPPLSARPQLPVADLNSLSDQFSSLSTGLSDSPPPYSPSHPAAQTSFRPPPSRTATSEPEDPVSYPEVPDASSEVSADRRRPSPRPYATVSNSSTEGTEERTGPTMPLPSPVAPELPGNSTGQRSPRSYSVPPSNERGSRGLVHGVLEHGAASQHPNGSLDRVPRCAKGGYVHWCTWYHDPLVPGFDICEECYRLHIQPTELGRYFRLQSDKDPSTQTCCDFNRARMKQVWAEAVRARNIDTARAYMRRRLAIPPCRGLDGISVGPETMNLKWYTMRNSEIQGWIACEACYEDVLCASPLISHFKPDMTQYPAGNKFICDMAYPFFKNTFDEFSKSGDWREFINLSNMRTKIQPCPGDQLVQATSIRWMRPKSYIQDVYVCSACYFDIILCTPWRDHFEAVETSFMRDVGKQWKCCLAVQKMRFSWDIMMDEKAPFDTWWHAARVLATTPACKNEGVENYGWYVLDGCENFDICPSCYHCYVPMFPAYARRFRLQHYPPGTVRACDFAPGAPRAGAFLVKFAQAVECKDFSIFRDYVREKAPLPPCPRSNPTANFRWWGIPSGFTCCEECFKDVVEGSALASQVTVRGEQTSQQFTCGLYSPRMRGIWAEACKQNDISRFVTAARERMQVYWATVPRCQMILETMKMRMSVRNTNLLAATMVMGADGVVGAASGGSHTHYGNAAVGYGWNTMAGAQAAVQSQAAMGMNVMPGNEMVEVAQLEALWKQVE